MLLITGWTISSAVFESVSELYLPHVRVIAYDHRVLVYQQIENNVLSPIVYRRTVQVPGMLVLVSVLIGEPRSASAPRQVARASSDPKAAASRPDGPPS